MFAWFSRILASIFGLRFFMGGTFMLIGGIVLYNLVVEIIEEVMTFTISQLSGTTASVASPTISGFVGWSVAQLKIPECFSVMVSCVILKWALRKIPFIRW